MTNKIIKFGAIALATWSFSATAVEKFDASILSIEGNVLVNQGESYRSGTAGMNLREGDRVMIMDGAELSMKYPDGCTFSFKDGQIIQVGSKSVCAMMTTGFVAPTTAQYVQAAPGTGDEDDDDGISAATSGSGGASWTVGLLLAGAALYLLTRDNDDNRPPFVLPPQPPRPPQPPVSP